VTSCGISGMDRARAMSPGEIAQESDEFVCKRLRSFAYVGNVPDVWLDESQRRNLDSCIEQGVKQRRAESSRTGSQKCDRFAVIRIDRCP
jgi:hypothetical protein